MALGDNVIGLVGTRAECPRVRSRKMPPFRINSFTTQALLDPTGSEAGNAVSGGVPDPQSGQGTGLRGDRGGGRHPG